MSEEKVSVLFVCMGNICRSPAGEGILKHLVKQSQLLNIYVESCGIGDWHLGHAPDWRIQKASNARGINLTSLAQQFQHSFFDHFNYILAADKKVLQFLYQYVKEPGQKAKIFLMTSFSPNYREQEIPDPYYQGDEAFELVLDMLQDSCKGLLEHIHK